MARLLAVSLVLVVVSQAFRTRHKSKTLHSSKKAATILRPGDRSNRQAYLHALSTTNRFCPTRCASEIVQPDSTAQLAEWLRDNQNKSFVVKGGGHSYACQSVPQDGGVLIHTEKMNGIRVFKRPDGSAYVRAGAGLTFDQLVPRLAKMNMSMPHGECLTVGLGGWTLNLGNHPELKNFDNKWGYDGKGFINKITMVSYAGSIFTITADDIELVERGRESWMGWHTRALLTKTKGMGIDFFSNQLANHGPVMKVFKLYGASLAIATEFEIELIPKSEPGFFQVTYGANDILDNKGGRGAKLMKAIVDVVANAGPDPDLDCGIFYASHYYKGTLEGVVALKCADWVSDKGETVAKYAPPGYRELEPKKSGFAFWALNGYGKGWIPSWHAEDLAPFMEKDGSEKYRDFIRAMEEGDEWGPNPCDACSSELMYMNMSVESVMFDNFCVGSQANQDVCSAFVFRSKGRFLQDRPDSVSYKQNLPDCKADPNWKSNLAEYGAGGGAAWAVGSALKGSWDGDRKVKFWLGLGERDDLPNSATCEAAQVQPAGATCVQNGITAEDLSQAELAKVGQKCPSFKSYVDYDDQNNLCSSFIYDVAEVPSITAVSE